MKTLLFYISGHGYGHARRTSQVIAALGNLAPELVVHVRTTAPKRIFAGLVPPERVTPTAIDAGAAERSPLEIDAAGTLDRIESLLARQSPIVADELAFIRTVRPSLIVSDIPFMAGTVAEAAGVPCIGLSNFSWDWIVEPFVESLGRSQLALDAIGSGYAAMEAILRMPLGGISGVFRKVIDVPLVANRGGREPKDVLRQLGIDASDRRTRVLFGIRGAVPTATLATAAASAKDILLLCPTNEPGEVPSGVLAVPVGEGLDFSDVLQACDVVVGKMGYGLIAECITSGVPLLWPRRTGFREDQVVERDGPAVMRMRELPMDDFHAGRWAEHIRAASKLPGPTESMSTDGAEVCAEWISGFVHRLGV
ncbi:hypothetical protein [Humisphaera borealis]|uniref:Glycosyl transferase family 28 C-terminal domain-containing protein n=1 Tax=Humisphaera borealis TaxID=2807512 RepID=A0A7M2X3A7_9BACT|nr:hypothetical protein [Humisphaera borealis]QOV92238.1 hypothetical protein IPV69_13125 [Humisphaera borealis]